MICDGFASQLKTVIALSIECSMMACLDIWSTQNVVVFWRVTVNFIMVASAEVLRVEAGLTRDTETPRIWRRNLQTAP